MADCILYRGNIYIHPWVNVIVILSILSGQKGINNQAVIGSCQSNWNVNSWENEWFGQVITEEYRLCCRIE